MNTHRKTTLIGGFVLVSLLLLVSLVKFIEPSSGDGKQIIQVKLTNVSGLSKGTRVSFAGKTVGEIYAIYPIAKLREQSVSSSGDLFSYLLTLNIDSKIKVYTTDTISSQTSGLLGEKSLVITPEPLTKDSRLSTKTTILLGSSEDLMDLAKKNITKLTDTAVNTLQSINLVISENQQAIEETVISTNTLFKKLNNIATQIEDSKLIESSNDMLCSIRDMTQSINTVAKDIEKTQLINSATAFVAVSTDLASTLNKTINKVTTGKGTLSRLINDDSLYLQSNALLLRTNSLLDSINTYGFLFNLNKQWQRSKMKVEHSPSSVHSISSGESYISTQVNEIISTLSNIDIALDTMKKIDAMHEINNQKFNSYEQIDSQLKALYDLMEIKASAIEKPSRFEAPKKNCHESN